MQMAENPAVGSFAGHHPRRHDGPDHRLSIPRGSCLIEKKPPGARQGILLGNVTIPFGCLAGGLVMLSSEFTVGMMLVNLIPVVIFSRAHRDGVKMIPNANDQRVHLLRQGRVTSSPSVWRWASSKRFLRSASSPKDRRWRLLSLSDSIATIGAIAIVLEARSRWSCSSTKVFKQPLLVFGRKLGMATCGGGHGGDAGEQHPDVHLMKDMDERGKVTTVAFAVSAAFVFGDHLASRRASERGLSSP